MFSQKIELLERLKQILDIEVTYPPTLTALSLLFFQSSDNTMPVATILIIASAKMAIPFIVYVLIKEKKLGWLVSLIVFIIIPSVVFYFIIKESVFSKYFLLIPFLIFYFYCLLLKYSVREWLLEAQARIELEAIKREKVNLNFDE